MEATYCIGTDVDVCRMFDQYLYKRSENLDLSLSVSQGLHTNAYNMTDQTFHTPSFGDEDFDIPPINPHHNSHPQANMGYHHQPAIQANDNMAMNDQQSYHQSLYSMAQSQEQHNMGLSVSSSYSSPSVQTQPNYSHPQQQMHLLHQQQQQQQQQQQHYGNMGPPYGRSPQGSSPSAGPIAAHENTTTSDDSDDSNTHNTIITGMKRPSPEPADNNNVAKIQKKPKTQKKKKKRDPNEPQKPVSAYALFFRDTQAAIKGQNPNASFGEVSKIVASMWDALDTEHKNVYKKKTEAAKKDYLKALAAYRASLVSKGGGESDNIYSGYGGYGGGYSGYSPPAGLPSPPMSAPSPQQITSMNKKPMILTEGRVSQQTQQGLMTGHIAQQQHIPQQQQQQQQQQQTLNPSNNIGSNYMQQQGAGTTSQQPVGTPPPPQQPAPPTQVPTTAAPLHCIRNGCQNPAITNSEWEDEYCSNECVVSHCRDVFTSWVASNQNAQNAHIEKNFSSVT